MLLALDFDEPGGLTHWTAPTSSRNVASRPAAAARACAWSTRLKSRGITFTNNDCSASKLSSTRDPSSLPVYCTCRTIRLRTSCTSSGSSSDSRSTISRIAAPLERLVRIEHVRDAAAHARREVPAGPAEHDDPAAGHVFAAVIADAFDDGERAAVAHREAFAGDAAEVRLAAGRAVERDVADEDVVLGDEVARSSADRQSSLPPDSPLPM